MGLIPGLGRSLGEGNGNPLQYSCLENSMDREAWWATSPWGCKGIRYDLATEHTHTQNSQLLTTVQCHDLCAPRHTVTNLGKWYMGKFFNRLLSKSFQMESLCMNERTWIAVDEAKKRGLKLRRSQENGAPWIRQPPAKWLTGLHKRITIYYLLMCSPWVIVL